MSGAALRALPNPDEGDHSWADVLRGAVRAEFQVDVYRPAPGDPVLFGPTCAVRACPGRGVNRSLGLKAKGANHSTGTRFRGYLCLSHVRVWRRDGEPPIDGWVRNARLTGRGQSPPVGCIVSACRRSARSNGFCNGHMSRWVSAGRPLDKTAFANAATAVRVSDGRCEVPACGFPPVRRDGFCDTHTQRYFNARSRRVGLSAAGYLALIAGARRIIAPRFDMRGLPAVVGLELALALQCRQQAGRAAILPLAFGQVVRWLRDIGAESVLERSEAFWVASARQRFPASVRGNPLGWLRFVRQSALRLREREGGLEIWGFDTWPVDRLDIDGRYAHQPGRRIYFSEIDPPWLRALVKRWARWRITTGTKSPASIACTTSSIRRFCRWAEEEHVTLTTPAAITRPLLERYLTSVRQLDRSVGRKSSLVTDLMSRPGFTETCCLGFLSRQWERGEPDRIA
ncbi:hypothetical protein NBH00_21490 [Paraconexibacter antarcticus]|uniref:Core-binding (CB) domain-containing protein n=1 Tax=Paraconexibacter antarcticus TaxID=2949664 RepID=A0ABY5DPE8_9ACTN|nr:hypothetical protein [Paraconexibacter antarcticus]UTI63905.1 hypothetical protein NBH00_21490 [Paraconexibacter antarcticus]